MGDCIFYTDRFLNITSWGKGISSFTGIKPAEAIGKKYYKVLSRIRLGNADAISKAMRDQMIILYKDYPLNSSQGERKADLEISAIIGRDKTIQGARVKITHDPSRSSIEHLQNFSDFFEAASHAHGLRGPLNTIKGASQFLRDSRPGDNEIIEYTDLIDEAVNQMDNIVSRFLNLPVKSFELSNIDINVMLKKIRSLISAQSRKHNIKTSYNLEKLPLVKGDALQIQQAIMNVVENAIEAMTGGGELKITTGVEHLQEGNFVLIAISDTGPGIMTSGKRQNRFKNSRGFGLTLTRLILHCHGGWMKINEEKTGTTVKLYLPLRREL